MSHAQLHSWGATLEVAFEQQVLAVMGLITELPTVAVPSTREVAAEGHDLQSLLYNFLDEWLFQFNSELFVCRRVKVTSFDRQQWRITSVGVGETFELNEYFEHCGVHRKLWSESTTGGGWVFKKLISGDLGV